MNGGGASILSSGNTSTKEESPCQTVNMEKNSVSGEGMQKKLFICPTEGSKKTPQSKG